ncbi:DUF805 domain-containing protein [Shimia sp. R10_1]|uniref:DUF805 domain-containing protein n=1 Tax=Shimia sp. R10_1 TaxID=2821095 RepID=UPI001ADAD844|nr:DUF805 domain-containing protein [Shimia sp. R10_1]MBO9471914.1 DUF805 domain-containing protein [Shimia sp. R10_1]
MKFTDAVKTCFGKYLTFSGRAQRSEYWWFVLFVVLVSVVSAILDSFLFGVDAETGEGRQVITPLVQLGVALPMLAAGWRRLHDTGRPGWYLLLPLGLSLASVVLLLSGVAAFSVLEQNVENADALRGPAAFLGVGGLVTVWILQLALSILMIWWLTRPSQEGENDYGPSMT